MDKLIDISKLTNTTIKSRKRKRRFRMSKNTKDTKPEREVQQILRDMDIKFETQHPIETKLYDIYIPSLNLLIEVDGKYWHSKDIDYMDKSKMQKKNFKNDLIKDGLATKHGYLIRRIWEDEITVETVKNLLCL